MRFSIFVLTCLTLSACAGQITNVGVSFEDINESKEIYAQLDPNGHQLEYYTLHWSSSDFPQNTIVSDKDRDALGNPIILKAGNTLRFKVPASTNINSEGKYIAAEWFVKFTGGSFEHDQNMPFRFDVKEVDIDIASSQIKVYREGELVEPEPSGSRYAYKLDANQLYNFEIAIRNSSENSFSEQVPIVLMGLSSDGLRPTNLSSTLPKKRKLIGGLKAGEEKKLAFYNIEFSELGVVKIRIEANTLAEKNPALLEPNMSNNHAEIAAIKILEPVRVPEEESESG